MTQLDEARGVARQLFRDLETIDPRTARTRAQQLAHMGITWLTPRRDTTDPSGVLTIEQVAEKAHVSKNVVSMWCSRGIRRGGRDVRLNRYRGEFDGQEVDDFLALRATPTPAGFSDDGDDTPTEPTRC